MPHKYVCCALDCGAKVTRDLYFCSHHWEMLPHRFKENLVEVYEHGQLKTKKVSADFVNELREAALWIANEEGLTSQGI